MYTIRFLKHSILPALLVLSLTGCDLFGSKDLEPGTVSLEVENAIGGQPLVLDQPLYTSAAGHTYSVSLFEYILTNLTLHHEDGTKVAIDHAHYCNQDDHDTHHLAPNEIPAGRYTAISFTFGVDGAENVFGNLERTTEFDNMMWPMMMPMGDGVTDRYHYMRFEGRYGTDGVFRIHTGPSGGGDYSFDVELPIDMEVDGEDWEISLVMNVDRWIDGPNVWNFADYGMIMGNQAAQALLQANGAGVFSVGAVTAE